MNGHAAPASFSYPKWVWSPTGGWWPHPAAWKRNTAVVIFGLALINYSVYKFASAREEVVFTLRGVDEYDAEEEERKKKQITGKHQNNSHE